MTTMDVSARMEREVLPHVRKPHRYAGYEQNRILKPDAEVRWALAFPDLYEIGMSNLGLQILYHRINGLEGVAAERVFLPAADASSLLRSAGLPLPTLESRTPLSRVDLLGISLSYELSLPGVLELLDLGGIPLRSEARGEGDPVVVAGGPVAYSPEPFGDFVDLVVLGDGEEVALEMGRLALRRRRQGGSRARLLDELARLEGVYRPGRQQLHETPEGLLVADRGGSEGPLVTGRTVERLRPEFYPDRPLVPLTEVAFDRVQLEVMRGCTRGCRFCQAGILYRPVRERPVQELVAQAEAAVAATGYDEISLTSLSTSDYAGLGPLVEALRETFRGRGVSLAFPSLRPDSFTREMARALPGQRKATLTFAPEAGTQRLRNIINKNTGEEDLLRAASIGFEEGYNAVKLYFMIGLPGESEQDLEGIAELAGKVAGLRTRKGQRVTVSVSPFAPKAHTPFQRHRQDSAATSRAKIERLRGLFRGHPAQLNVHNPEVAVIEAALGRGDRRLGGVLERAWREGAVLEGWSDHFDAARWQRAFAEEGLAWMLEGRLPSGGGRVPWDHVSKGVTERYFSQEAEKALLAQTSPDCREGRCDACGLARFIPRGQVVCNLYPAAPPAPGEATPEAQAGERVATARLLYRRGEPMRWTGHLDLVRVWDRWLRRAGVPVAFSRGFNPHPRISFGPPLPVGLTSEGEYADLDLTEVRDPDELMERLNRHAPEGIEVREAAVTEGKLPSLAATVGRIEYRFRGNGGELAARIESFLASERVEVERMKKGKLRKVDLRRYVEAVEPEGAGSYRLRVRVEGGATARLDELARCWGLEQPLGDRPRRLAMLEPGEEENGWRRPLERVRGTAAQQDGT